MRLTRLIIPLLLTAVLAMPAYGYRIYNKMSQKADFAGEDCAHCFEGNIAPGDDKACPGGDQGCRGETYISIRTERVCIQSGESGQVWVTYLYSPIQVDAHGWIEVYDGFKCIVYAEDGTPKSATINGITVGGKDASGNPKMVEMLETCGGPYPKYK